MRHNEHHVYLLVIRLAEIFPAVIVVVATVTALRARLGLECRLEKVHLDQHERSSCTFRKKSCLAQGDEKHSHYFVPHYFVGLFYSMEILCVQQNVIIFNTLI